MVLGTLKSFLCFPLDIDVNDILGASRILISYTICHNDLNNMIIYMRHFQILLLSLIARKVDYIFEEPLNSHINVG